MIGEEQIGSKISNLTRSMDIYFITRVYSLSLSLPLSLALFHFFLSLLMTIRTNYIVVCLADRNIQCHWVCILCM